MSLGDFFSLLTGSGAPNNSQQPQSTGGGVADLLGSILGGGQAASGGGDPAANLLGALLGGGQAAAPAGQPAAPGAQNAAPDMLSMILNVAQSPAGASFVQPIVNNVAAKLGIPPQTALMVVTFAIHYLATNHGAIAAKGEDLAGVLKQHSKAKYIQTNNISAQLANQTGLDEKTAAKAMAEVFKMLGASQ